MILKDFQSFPSAPDVLQWCLGSAQAMLFSFERFIQVISDSHWIIGKTMRQVIREKLAALTIPEDPTTISSISTQLKETMDALADSCNTTLGIDYAEKSHNPRFEKTLAPKPWRRKDVVMHLTKKQRERIKQLR